MKTPLAQILSSIDIQKLFGNMTVIYGINETLYANLKERMESFDYENTTIGDVFVNMIPFLGVYSDYCCNYDSATQLFSTLKSTNSSFMKIIKDATPRCNGYDLSDLIIMPVQRLARYKLLLDKLIQSTPESHPDYVYLKKAVDLVADKASDVNKKMKLVSQQRVMTQLHKRFLPSQQLEGGLVQPWRYHICQLNFKFFPTKSPEPIDVFLFIFNDILIISKKNQDDTLECIAAPPLWSLFLKRLEPSWELSLITNPPFQIVSPSGTWNVLPNNDETKLAFKNKLESARDEYLSLYSEKKYKRTQIKVYVNNEKQEWMAVQPAPTYASNRVSSVILAQETKEFTKKALEELLEENRELLESRPIKTPKKNRLTKIRDEFSKTLSPRKSSKKPKTPNPRILLDEENMENANQADLIRQRILKLDSDSTPKTPLRTTTPTKKNSSKTPKTALLKANI